MGNFDDLIPQSGISEGIFNDLIPVKGNAAGMFADLTPVEGSSKGMFDDLIKVKTPPELNPQVEQMNLGMSLITPFVAWPVSKAAGAIRSLQSGSAAEGVDTEAEAYQQMTSIYRPNTIAGQKLLEAVGKVMSVPADVAKELISLPLESWKASGAARYIPTALAEFSSYLAFGKAGGKIKEGIKEATKITGLKDVLEPVQEIRTNRILPLEKISFDEATKIPTEQPTGETLPPETGKIVQEIGQRAKRIDKTTGLPLNPDGTVTLYHGTTKDVAENIRKTGIIKSAAEPDIYLSTAKEGTGYGDTSVPVNIDPRKLILDDEFPDGRKDFRIDTGKSGGGVKVNIPPETTPKPVGGGQFEPSTTGIKNAVVDAERAARGLEPIESPLRGMPNWEKTKDAVDTGVIDPRIIAKEIVEKGKNATAEDKQALLYDKMKLSNEQNSVMNNIEKAMESGAKITENTNRERLKILQDAYDMNEQATKKSASEWGIMGNVMQQLVAEDYSLAKNMQRARIASRTGEVSPEVTAKIEQLSKQFEAANAKITAYEEQTSQRGADVAVLKLRNEIAKEQRQVKRTYKKQELDVEFKGLIDELNSVLGGKLSVGIDPEGVLILGKMAKNRVKSGIITAEGLVDSIYTELKNVGIELTKRDIRVAISNYGITSHMSKEYIDVTLRELKHQIRLVLALEDARAKQIPLRSGLQRDKPTDIVRSLERQVKQAMRESGIDSTKTRTPEEQWKTSLDAVKTRLRNQISDLTKQIETGEKTPKRIGIKYDEEANALKEVRDKLKATLAETEGKTEMSAEQRVKNAMAAVAKSISEYERRIKERDLTPAQKISKTPETPELKKLRSMRDDLKRTYNQMQKDARPAKSPEEIALQSFKTRTTNRIVELQNKLASGDFTIAPRKVLVLDPTAQRLKADMEKIKTQVDDAIRKQEFENQTPTEKGLYYVQKWRRAIILSSVTTLGKLTSAAMQRFAITPIEELVGGVLSNIPGISKIAAKAPREGGGLNITAEAKAFSQFIARATLKDIQETAKTGKGSLDYLYGKKGGLPPEALDFFGHLHGALKVLPKRAEFFRSLEKRSAWAMKNGKDIQSPQVQMELCADAYIDSNRAILMNDNAANSAYRMMLGYLRGRGLGGKFTSTALQIGMPIVKVPTNFAIETFNYAGGSVKGALQVIQTLIQKDALKNLKPVEADNIMRSLKKGSIGLALLAIGYYSPDIFGGFYQPGEKRETGDIKAGGLKIAGTNIPNFLLHSPPLEVLQMGATMRRVIDKKDSVASGILAANVGAMKRIPFLEEPSRMMGNMVSADKASIALAELGKSMTIPPDVQRLAQITDPQGDQTRKAIIMKDVFKKGIPGLREEVPLKDEARSRSIGSRGSRSRSR